MLVEMVEETEAMQYILFLLKVKKQVRFIKDVLERVVTCPSSMSLCRPERSCSVLLVLRIDRLWDFLFCLAWRAAALLPLSTGIPPSRPDLHHSLKEQNAENKVNQRVMRTISGQNKSDALTGKHKATVVAFGSFHMLMC